VDVDLQKRDGVIPEAQWNMLREVSAALSTGEDCFDDLFAHGADVLHCIATGASRYDPTRDLSVRSYLYGALAHKKARRLRGLYGTVRQAPWPADCGTLCPPEAHLQAREDWLTLLRGLERAYATLPPGFEQTALTTFIRIVFLEDVDFYGWQGIIPRVAARHGVKQQKVSDVLRKVKAAMPGLNPKPGAGRFKRTYRGLSPGNRHCHGMAGYADARRVAYVVGEGVGDD